MVERQGQRARARRNSKILECAARWFCSSDYVRDYGDWQPLDVIFNNMTFKNGNLYKNHRFQKSKWTLASHMKSHRAFKFKRVKNETLFSFDKSKYDEYFSVDPIIRSKQDPNMKIYQSPKSINSRRTWGDGTRWVK